MPLFTIAGDREFEFYRTGTFTRFSDVARQAVVHAMVGVVEGTTRTQADLTARFERPGSDDRARGRVFATVSRAIDRAGYEGLQSLAQGDHGDLWLPPIQPPVSSNLSDLNELEALVADVESSPLELGWPKGSCPPSDREAQKAIKYAFGQNWRVVVQSTRPLKLSVEPCYRFKAHLAGRHLADETERARTSAFRAIDLVIHATTRSNLDLVAFGASTYIAADPGKWARDFQARLRATLVDIVENRGHDGLVDVLWQLDACKVPDARWGTASSPRGIPRVEWDMEIADYVFPDGI